MNILSIKYKDGSSEEISNAYTVVDHGDGEISYFIGSGWTRYHALDVESFTVTEPCIVRSSFLYREGKEDGS